MAKRPAAALAKGFDRELADFPAELRWREWMARVEAVIFASPVPVGTRNACPCHRCELQS
jgi:hypothetical protein